MRAFSLLITLLTLSLTTFSQKLESPEMLGQLVFDALKTKNQELFKKAWTTKLDLKFAITKKMEQKGQTYKKIDDDKIDQLHVDYLVNIAMSFTETIANGESDGIKWAYIVYSKTDYYPRLGTTDSSIKIGNVYLEIIYKKRKYSIKIGDSLKIKDNWTIEDRISWKGLVED